MTAWEQLVARYADGRPICNCRQAYYGVRQESGSGTASVICPDGCAANCRTARDEIAQRVLQELPLFPSEGERAGWERVAKRWETDKVRHSARLDAERRF